MPARLFPTAPVALLSALLLASGCGEEPPTETFELEGKITDSVTGEGIGGVQVIFTSDTLFREEARTGSAGNYEMQVESDTRFGQVRAAVEGYEPEEATVFFDSRSRRIDLELRTLPPAP